MCNMYCILGNFCVAKFSLISHIFASLQKYCHDLPFLLATWVIRENIFCEIFEISVFAKIL